MEKTPEMMEQGELSSKKDTGHISEEPKTKFELSDEEGEVLLTKFKEMQRKIDSIDDTLWIFKLVLFVWIIFFM